MQRVRKRPRTRVHPPRWYWRHRDGAGPGDGVEPLPTHDLLIAFAWAGALAAARSTVTRLRAGRSSAPAHAQQIGRRPKTA